MKKTGWKMVKEKLSNNLILKVGSILFAVILWLVSININDPQKTVTIKNIPVEILNEDIITGNDMIYKVVSGDTISVKVTGPRTIVDSLKAKDFTVTADFKEISQTNAVPLKITLNNENYESKVVIGEKSSNTLRLELEDILTKEYTITPEFVGNVASDYTLYQSALEETLVNVRAPESVHKMIQKVVAVVTLNNTETEDFTYYGNLVIYSYQGSEIDKLSNNIILSEETKKVFGTVYYKKTLPLKYTVVNRLGTTNILGETTASPEEITVAGRKELLDEISQINVPEDTIVVDDSNTEFVLDIQGILPEGVYLISSTKELTINVSLNKVTTKNFIIKSSEVGIKNIPEGLSGSIINNGDITIQISGQVDIVNSIAVDDMSPEVSLEGLGEGNHIVSLLVSLPDGIRMVNTVSIEVNLNDKNKQTGETPTSSETETPTPEETETTTPPTGETPTPE